MFRSLRGLSRLPKLVLPKLRSQAVLTQAKKPMQPGPLLRGMQFGTRPVKTPAVDQIFGYHAETAPLSMHSKENYERCKKFDAFIESPFNLIKLHELMGRSGLDTELNLDSVYSRIGMHAETMRELLEQLPWKQRRDQDLFDALMENRSSLPYLKKIVSLFIDNPVRECLITLLDHDLANEYRNKVRPNFTSKSYMNFLQKADFLPQLVEVLEKMTISFEETPERLQKLFSLFSSLDRETTQQLLEKQKQGAVHNLDQLVSVVADIRGESFHSIVEDVKPERNFAHIF